jgi:hypothetical protein
MKKIFFSAFCLTLFGCSTQSERDGFSTQYSEKAWRENREIIPVYLNYFVNVKRRTLGENLEKIGYAGPEWLIEEINSSGRLNGFRLIARTPKDKENASFFRDDVGRLIWVVEPRWVSKRDYLSLGFISRYEDKLPTWEDYTLKLNSAGKWEVFLTGLEVF